MAPTLSDPAPALHLAGPPDEKIMVSVYPSGKLVPTTSDVLTLLANVNYEFSYPIIYDEAMVGTYLTLSNSLDGHGPTIGENIFF